MRINVGWQYYCQYIWHSVTTLFPSCFVIRFANVVSIKSIKKVIAVLIKEEHNASKTSTQKFYFSQLIISMQIRKLEKQGGEKNILKNKSLKKVQVVG